ncbi:prepilin-type N-terminal cleavage/methylation domain-containing protein [Mitsuaria sp. WAJ17]|uniref:type IV pilin protein n=1 Tax=Mitsuaria sp. WAJ17 TaxID=2761452 RepID=UPI001601B946|nr:type IV pilin protein [Mitsuaria sp. WAJ17]MBB2486396.1 prepilin-type N-terminal cleavage/methylation domain-containing protein [Mitsuaria sp. WAJ17]
MYRLQPLHSPCFRPPRELGQDCPSNLSPENAPLVTHPARRCQSGLSLIEVLVALCITATLAALAWPRFEGVLHRARRSEAQTALSEVLNAQSRYRSSHGRYAGSLAELGLAASPLQHYQLRLLDLPKSDADPDAEPFSKGFVAQATPQLTSPQAHDRACAVLRLTLEGRQLTHSASDAAGRPSTPCWPR